MASAAIKIHSSPVVVSWFCSTHREWIPQWVHWREAGLGIVPWSSSYKQAQLKYIQKYFERWAEISSANLHTWLDETPVQQKTLRVHKHAPVSSMAKFLHMKGLLSTDELTRIRFLYPKRDPYTKPKQRIINKEGLMKILEAAEVSAGHNHYQRILNKTLILFYAYTGLRSAEGCNLELDDLVYDEDPKRSYVLVRCGKGGKQRKVPFPKIAQEAIKEYLQVRPTHVNTNRLFLGFNPMYGYRPLTTNNNCKRFKRISEIAGIDFTAHSLRHYKITEWASRSGIPINTARLWAGHSSILVTERYIHVTDDEALEDAYE